MDKIYYLILTLIVLALVASAPSPHRESELDSHYSVIYVDPSSGLGGSGYSAPIKFGEPTVSAVGGSGGGYLPLMEAGAHKCRALAGSGGIGNLECDQ